jgi:hypothetical protein
MGRPTGYTSKTKRNLLLGAGALYKNFVVGTDTPSSATAKIIGATQGGLEFKAVPTIRNIQIDGILGKVADLDVIDAWECSLAGSFIEINSEVIRRSLAAVTQTSDSDYDIFQGSTEFDADDYLTNVTYIGTLAGSETPVILQINNAIDTQGLTFKTEDGKEGTVDVTFEGRYAISDNGVPPFKIYWPKTAVANTLSALTIGSLVLSPTFDAATTTYTATTTNAKDAVTATATSAGAEIVVKNGSTVIENGGDATWSAGSNTVTVKVTGDEGDKTYTVTVTKS